MELLKVKKRILCRKQAVQVFLYKKCAKRIHKKKKVTSARLAKLDYPLLNLQQIHYVFLVDYCHTWYCYGWRWLRPSPTHFLKTQAGTEILPESGVEVNQPGAVSSVAETGDELQDVRVEEGEEHVEGEDGQTDPNWDHHVVQLHPTSLQPAIQV